MIRDDVSYAQDGHEMLGRVVVPVAATPLPGIVLLHGAHGLDGVILEVAERLASAGFAVMAADLWGGRALPAGPDEVGPRIGSLIQNRAGWVARIDAALAVLATRPEVDAARIGALGYCLGGAGVLELVRSGGAIRSGVALHPGLDLVAEDWSGASAARTFLAVGSADPMATAEHRDRVCAAMTEAGVPWEVAIYGGAKHGFTEPDAPGRPPFAAYDPWADRRSWASAIDFLTTTLAED